MMDELKKLMEIGEKQLEVMKEIADFMKGIDKNIREIRAMAVDKIARM